MINKDDLFRAKIVLKGQRYPQGKVENGGYAILSAEVIEVTEGNTDGIDDWNKQIILKGTVPVLDFKASYNFTGEYIEDAQWGKQYNIIALNEQFDIETDEDKRAFLSLVLTENQLNNLYNMYDNPFDLIANENVPELIKVKGIGVATSEKLIDRFKANIDNSKAYLGLMEYGLTKNMIDKLVESYESIDILIGKIKENPYVIAGEVDGIGWKKADSIALGTGIDRLSHYRLSAFITYYLEQRANRGDSWVTPVDVMEALWGEIDEDLNREHTKPVFDKLYEDEIVIWDEDRTFIALNKYYHLERSIAENLIRISNSTNTFEYEGWEKVTKEIEREQGWEYTDEQLKGIETVLKNQVTVITGYGGCVDNKTEYFNGEKWVSMDKYKKGDKVLQFDPITWKGSLVEPIEYHKYEEQTMFMMTNKSGTVNQVLSYDHNVGYVTSKGHVTSKPLNEVMEMHNNSETGFNGKFLNAFNYEGGKGIDLSDEEIRVMVAVMADGTFYSKAKEYNDSYMRCRFHIKKDRKKKRLRETFINAKYIWREKESAAQGYTDLYIDAPLRIKQYPKEWYNATKEQLEIIADEAMYWDGSFGQKGRRSFATTIKSDADFIQFVFSSLGHTANVLTYDRRGEMTGGYERKSIDYEVNISKREFRLTSIKAQGNNKVDISPYTGHDGYKYCFTVPTEYLILRRENKIFVTHNTGKTSIANAMMRILDQYSKGLCALAGRASARIAETTGLEGHTIHRLLGYSPVDGYLYNRNRKLPIDIVLLDETSMVGGRLYYRLIQAINNGSKFIMLGDDGQLESIGTLNIFKDLLDSGVIPSVKLTEIHRQAQKSAITTESIKLRNGEQLFKSNWTGIETRGELQDLKLEIYDEKEMTFFAVMDNFKEQLKKYKNINDVQVIVPVKYRGDASLYALNNEIQDYYNPQKGNWSKEMSVKRFVKKQDFSYILKEGDKVINRKNNRKATHVNTGKEIPIWNGDIGIVKEINGNSGLIITFQMQGDVYVRKNKNFAIELGYAITVHSSQGSQYKSTVIGIDYSSYSLLSRELVYTAITRAEENCVLCAENTALEYAINTSRVPHKQTFLHKFLHDMQEEYLGGEVE